MNILVLTAHPDLATSRINRAWHRALSDTPGVTTRDLTAIGGPQMKFDRQEEQDLLLAHDRMVFQFPFYWYSSPPILKAWTDHVLSYGFAYGPGGNKLNGREFLCLVSTGGPDSSYHAGGYNNFSMSELLRPFQQTAHLTGMTYLRPFVLHGLAQADEAALSASLPRMIAHVTDPDLDPKIRHARLLREIEADPQMAAAVS